MLAKMSLPLSWGFELWALGSEGKKKVSFLVQGPLNL